MASLTRAPLGYFYNAPHWGGGLFRAPPYDLPKLLVNSVSDICKYHLLYFVTIIEVKVMSGHQEKKVKQKNFVI